MTTSPRFFAATRTVFAETRLVDVRACIIIFRKFRVRVYAVATRATLGRATGPGAGHPIPRFAVRDPSILSRSARPNRSTDRESRDRDYRALRVCVNSARGSTYVHPRSPPSRGPNLPTWNLDLGRDRWKSRVGARAMSAFSRDRFRSIDRSMDGWLSARQSEPNPSVRQSTTDGRTDGRAASE